MLLIEKSFNSTNLPGICIYKIWVCLRIFSTTVWTVGFRMSNSSYLCKPEKNRLTNMNQRLVFWSEKLYMFFPCDWFCPTPTGGVYFQQTWWNLKNTSVHLGETCARDASGHYKRYKQYIRCIHTQISPRQSIMYGIFTYVHLLSKSTKHS